MHQLEYFVTVADEASFTRAASALHVSQPGVSAQIRRLERELGQELLDRAGRSVRLTEAGRAALPHARAALAGVAGVRDSVDELRGLVRGRVAVGAVTSHDVDLPGLLAAFHANCPAIEISLVENNSDQLVAALRDGRLDAAIIALGPEPLQDMAVRVVDEQPIVVAVSPGDEWARRAAIPLAALRDRVVASLPRGTGIRSILEEACASAGFVPQVAFEANAPETLVGLAARGLGVAVVPSSIAARAAGVVAVPISGPALYGRLGFAWRSRRPISPAGRAFAEHIAATFGERS